MHIFKQTYSSSDIAFRSCPDPFDFEMKFLLNEQENNWLNYLIFEIPALSFYTASLYLSTNTATILLWDYELIRRESAVSSQSSKPANNQTKENHNKNQLLFHYFQVHSEWNFYGNYTTNKPTSHPTNMLVKSTFVGGVVVLSNY